MSPAERARHASLVRWGKEQPFAARLEAVRERRKAVKQKKAKGRGKAPKKPALTPEEKEAQAVKERAANVASVGDALNQSDNETLSKNGLDGLVSAASGQGPPSNVAQGLIDKGLAVRGEDGRFRLTADGSAIVRAAESGDSNTVLDRLSAVNDKNVAAAEKEKAEKPGKGGGGGGSKQKTDEEKEREKEEKRVQTRATTAEKVDLKPAEADALLSAAEGGEVDEADVDNLAELGLVRANGEGGFEATDAGRRALAALERGDVRGYRAAIQDAKERSERTQAREAARKQRQADRRAREDERRRKEDGEGGEREDPAPAPDKGRTADDRLRGRDGQRKPGRERRGPTRPGLYSKGIDDMSYTPLLEELEALRDEVRDLAEEEDTAEVKAGRRNSGADQATIDRGYALAEELRDLFEALGATVEDEGESEVEEGAMDMDMENKSINYDQAAQLVRDAWVQREGKGDSSSSPYPWPQAVFDDGVIVSQDGCLYFVPYRREEGAIVFSPRNEWRMARQTYITQDGDVKAQRTFGGKERGDVPDEDFAGPEKTYPIMTADDVRDAAQLIGKADDPEAVKKKIIAIAKRKGFADAIPESWMETKKSLDGVWLIGDEVKALGGGRVGGLAVRFGSEDEPDMSHMQDYFTKSTSFWLDQWDRRPMLYHHAMEENTSEDPIIGVWNKATVTDEGVWLEGELSKSFKYQAAIKELIRRGVLRISTDSAPHLVRRSVKTGGVHEITRWPICAASLTVSAAEPRLSGVSFKSLIDELGLPLEEEEEVPEVKTDDRARRLLLELDLLTLEQVGL